VKAGLTGQIDVSDAIDSARSKAHFAIWLDKLAKFTNLLPIVKANRANFNDTMAQLG
jgi:hypothetical protein